MKKTMYTTVFMLIAASLAVAQTTVEKTLVKSFNLKGLDQVVLDLNGDIDVQERAGEIVRVQMTIGISGSGAMLKSLITAGRYNLKMTETEDGALINSPNINREIMVGGKKLVENVNYTVYVPENVTVKYGSEVSSSTAGTNESF